MKNLHQMIEEAKKALNTVNDGNTYISSYVVNRFVKAAELHPQDQLIGNMRDVLVKKASKQMFFSQKELSSLYQELYGFSGGQTAFKNELADLISEDSSLSKVAYSSDKRTQEEINPEPIFKDSNLSNAFSVLFSLGSDSELASYKKIDNKAVEKTVINKLSKLGKAPVNILLSGQNEHFVLATALYQDRRHNQLALQIPVQISNGQVLEPELMIHGTEAIPLTKDNLYVYLKETANYKKATARNKVGGNHDGGFVKQEQAVMPVTLEKIANFETDMIKAAAHFSPEQVNIGSAMVTSEISAYTKVKPQVKVSTSSKDSIVFTATFPTPKGSRVAIDIPVEYHNKKPILPSKFAVNLSTDKTAQKYYDFDKEGFASLWQHLDKTAHDYNKVARINGLMGEMSYHQLMDQVIEGAAKKDYSLAEDAIGVISEKFGNDLAKEALKQYGTLLKYASPVGNQRTEFIKVAKKRGQLIEIPTSLELYNPKLGLTISKIDFDHEGNMYPKGRVPKYDNQNSEEQVISTSKIILS